MCMHYHTLRRGSEGHYPSLIVPHQVGARLVNRNGANPGEPSEVFALVNYRPSILSQHLSMSLMFQGYFVDPSSGMCSLRYYWPQKQAVRPKRVWIRRGIWLSCGIDESHAPWATEDIRVLVAQMKETTGGNGSRYLRDLAVVVARLSEKASEYAIMTNASRLAVESDWSLEVWGRRVDVV